jgi:hypothetical protein
LFSATVLATVASAQSSLTILNNSFPIGAVGQTYAQALSATGGTAPYSWSATGQIPPGLAVNSVGTISGTPRTGGTYAFTLTVVDVRQATASKALSIVISGPGPAPLTVTSTTLPASATGQSYNQTLTATGGTPPYQWSAGVGFPSFLTLDPASGTLSGTPTAAGVYIFSVVVTDSANLSATGTVSLPVNNPPPRITTQSPIFGGTLGVPYVQTFQASGGNPPYTWTIVSGDAGGLVLDPASGDLKGTPQTAGTFNFTIRATDRFGRDSDPGVFARRQPSSTDSHHHVVVAGGYGRSGVQPETSGRRQRGYSALQLVHHRRSGSGIDLRSLEPDA